MRSLLFTTIIAFSASAAMAEGLYLKGELGYGFGQDADITNQGDGSNPIEVGDSLKDIDDSYGLGFGAGYQINDNFRTDAMLNYRTGNELDDSDSINQNFTADIDSISFMLSGYLEQPVGDGRFVPYLMAGLGTAYNSTDKMKLTSVGSLNTGPDGDNFDFAWQVGAGAGYKITETVALDLGYKYVDLGSIEWDGGDYVDGVGAVTPDTNGLEGDLAAHEISLGLRYSF